MEYGSGAIFGCPAHDQRDLDFARKYGLPVTPVVLPPDADPADFAIGGEAYAGDDGTAINRSEEHTSELQSLMRISYAVFCLKKKNDDIFSDNNFNSECAMNKIRKVNTS